MDNLLSPVLVKINTYGDETLRESKYFQTMATTNMKRKGRMNKNKVLDNLIFFCKKLHESF